MLHPALVKRIERNLAEGQLTQREIAQKLGVGRGSVLAIAKRRRSGGQCSNPMPEPHEVEKPIEPAEWCPGCRAMVQMPCLLCTLRHALANGWLKRSLSGHDAPLRLDLKPTHRKRYEQVVARRKAEAALQTEKKQQRRNRAEDKRRRVRAAERMATGQPS
ncbi:MAG: hypothetical protein GXY83_14380 [Rhodopirellula sp.]|nr:hypothetical protein [Rhodopirellula sp.]